MWWETLFGSQSVFEVYLHRIWGEHRPLQKLVSCKVLARRFNFSLDFLLKKKLTERSSRSATLLNELSGIE